VGFETDFRGGKAVVANAQGLAEEVEELRL
jgi:hypothetical protein